MQETGEADQDVNTFTAAFPIRGRVQREKNLLSAT